MPSATRVGEPALPAQSPPQSPRGLSYDHSKTWCLGSSITALPTKFMNKPFRKTLPSVPEYSSTFTLQGKGSEVDSL